MSCNGVYDGAFHGNIIVSTGQNCVFTNGGAIAGNVLMSGGHFTLSGAALDGNLTVNSGGTFILGPGAKIGGNLVVQDLPAGGTKNSVCGATVLGNLVFSNNDTTVQIGSAAPLVCAGNKISKSLTVRDNTGSVLIFANIVGGNTTVTANTGPLDVVGNAIGNVLQCAGNTMLIMGGGNTAKVKQGQCY